MEERLKNDEDEEEGNTWCFCQSSGVPDCCIWYFDSVFLASSYQVVSVIFSPSELRKETKV